jgi:2-polyprenyl-3-methyl-5-hydroxy-6-metoxy-1,4-benzoquinol methylase
MIMNNSEPACLVCKSNDFENFITCTDYFVSKGQFSLLRCNHCGFVFTGKAPDLEKMGSYYKSDSYISHSDTQKGLVNKLYHKVRNIMLDRKRKLINRETFGKDLLDIGCGTGYFPKFMKDKGFRVTGIELDEGARNFARENFGIEVFHPEEMLNTAINEKFDVITLWHVLEHLHDPDRYLQWITKALKEEGILIIALPNNDSYDAKVYQKYWAAYDVPRHLWHFTPATFKKYLSGKGFSLGKIKRLPFDAYYNSLMSAKYAGKFSPLVHGFFVGWLSNLFSFFSAEKTSSVIYILKKQKTT